MNQRPDLVHANVAIVELTCMRFRPLSEWSEFGADFSDDPGSLESLGIHWMNRVHIARSKDGEPAVSIPCVPT